jgi:hypothetical protein
MNLNELAQHVSLAEGGKKNLSIAEIKEVISCLGVVLASVDESVKDSLFKKIVTAGKRKLK